MTTPEINANQCALLAPGFHHVSFVHWVPAAIGEGLIFKLCQGEGVMIPTVPEDRGDMRFNWQGNAAW